MIKIANAPCSWGILEFDFVGKAAGYTQVLDEMQATGYIGTELGDWNFMPTDPVLLKQEITARNLEMLGAFVPVDFSNPDAHASGAETAIRTAKLLALVGEAPLIVLADDNCKNLTRTKNAGRIQTKHGLSDEEWAVFARGVELVTRKVWDETGIRCVFHHHCAGFVETPYEIEKLLLLTDPNLIGLCFDTGHYTFGGGDAVEGIRKYAQRIWHVHFKDFSTKIATQARENGWDYFESVQNGIFCELGQGGVDFPVVIQELNKAEYSGWIVVEQDVLPGMGSPKDSAMRNREYLRKLGL